MIRRPPRSTLFPYTTLFPISTMVYVTHDQVEALTLGDRVAVLDAGAIRQVGTPDEVFAAPVDRFVARFLGTPPMNLLPPELLALDGLPDVVEVGIRPEHVRLGGDGVPAEVQLVEPVGSEAYVHLDLRPQVTQCHLPDGARIVARVATQDRAETGGEVRVALRREDVHLFDRESGRRVEWA